MHHHHHHLGQCHHHHLGQRHHHLLSRIMLTRSFIGLDISMASPITTFFNLKMASSSLLCTLPNTAKVVSIVIITLCPNDNGGARPPLVVGRHLHRIMDGAQRVESRGFGRKLGFIQIPNQAAVPSLNCQDKLSISNLSSRNMGSS